MAKISQKTIDLIKDTADIVDVVGEFVSLQVAGKNMKGLCPFHNEKTPSFFVSKERQIFTCFGCGAKGNAITFIQKIKNISFVEALKYLADKYNIELEIANYNSGIQSSKNLYKANELALNFYNLNLLNLESGKKALNYLRNRGLNIEIIQEFELGYAPRGKDNLFSHLKKDYQPLDLLNAGLIIRNESGDYYDLFRDRIMFPIRDETNKVIAFSGRVYGISSNNAKYVNSPYTELFSKGAVLYNLAKAMPYIKTNKRVILMEGYMDVIKAYKFGIKEVVCSMGTQLTIDQALKLKEHTDNVLICYDGDRAGREATFKALKLLERTKLSVKIIMLPNGLDPDEYMNKYSDFLNYVNNNQIDQYDFVYKIITENIDISKPQDIENCKNKLFDYFKTTSGLIRDIYFKKYSNEVLVGYDTLIRDYQKYLIENRIMDDYKRIVTEQKQIKILKPKYKEAERRIFNYYLQNDSYRTIVDDRYHLLEVKEKDILVLLESIKELRNQIGNKSPLVLLRSDISEKLKKKLDEILLRKDYEYNIEDFDSCIRQLEIQKLESQIANLKEEANICLNSGDTPGFISYQNKILEKQQQIKKLGRNK